MYTNRADERGQLPPRASRFFMLEDGWYFSAREKSIMGPYNSQSQAEKAFHDFIQFIQHANKPTLHAFLSSLAETGRRTLLH